MFNFGRKPTQTTEGDTANPGSFEVGSMESRAAARLRAKQLEEQCTCFRLVAVQFAPEEVQPLLKSLVERSNRGEARAAEEEELLNRHSTATLQLPESPCPVHRPQTELTEGLSDASHS